MKILIKEANWLGDAIMAIPSIIALRDKYPEAQMTLVTKGPIIPLFKLLPWEIESISFESITSWLNLRKERFDLGIIFPNSFRSALEVFLTGARRRIGYATCGRSLFLTQRIPLNKKKTHMADYYYNLLEVLGIKGERPNPTLVVKEKDKEKIYSLLKEKGINLKESLITVSPGASYGEAKCWPEENFAALTQRLSEKGEIIFVGTESERAIIERIIHPLRKNLSKGGKAFNLAGETTLLELAGLFSISKVVISNDNGAMHLAAMLGKDVVSLFGPTDPLRTGPIGDKAIVLHNKVDCSPCKKRACSDKRCFKNITVERVYEAIRSII